MQNVVWQDWIDRERNDKEFNELILEIDKHHKLLVKDDKLDKNIYFIFNYELGLSLEFRSNRLKNVYLYNNSQQFKQYRYEVYRMLGWEMNGQEVLECYGEPNVKGGGGVTNIYVVYERLGLEVDFKSRYWEHSGIMVDYVVIFQKNSS